MNTVDHRSLALVMLFAAGTVMAQGHEHGERAAPAVRKPQLSATQEWTRFPLLLSGMGAERGVVRVRAENLEALSLNIFAPGSDTPRSQQQFPMTAEGASVTAPRAETGNYHWLSARSEADGQITVANTVHYFSNPGPSPVELLLDRKSELEIVPNPLPREHGAYRESEKWDFLVRFNGQALASKELVMETEFGSRIRFTTNSIGIATALFPRDMRETAGKSAGHRPQPGKFVLAVAHEADGKRYLTAFNYSYRKDPERNSSLNAGYGFLVLGMLGALPLLRRRKESKGDDNA